MEPRAPQSPSRQKTVSHATDRKATTRSEPRSVHHGTPCPPARSQGPPSDARGSTRVYKKIHNQAARRVRRQSPRKTANRPGLVHRDGSRQQHPDAAISVARATRRVRTPTDTSAHTSGRPADQSESRWGQIEDESAWPGLFHEVGHPTSRGYTGMPSTKSPPSHAFQPPFPQYHRGRRARAQPLDVLRDGLCQRRFRQAHDRRREWAFDHYAV